LTLGKGRKIAVRSVSGFNLVRQNDVFEFCGQERATDFRGFARINPTQKKSEKICGDLAAWRMS
jgi:hypothetical protein